MSLFHIVDTVTILIIITILHWILKTPANEGLRLLLILLISLVTEVANSILLHYGESIKLTSTLSVIFTDLVWLGLLTKYVYSTKAASITLAAFLIYSLLNITCVEGPDSFNFNTFIVGSLLYLIIFIYTSFLQLKNEKLSFFLNNYYLLLCCPIIYFLGFSFLFGFSSKAVNSYLIFGNLKLYTFVMYFVNIVYYSLINIYIYREKKLQNAR